MDYRARIAYSLMGMFVVLTSIGVGGTFGVSAGLIAAGITSGLLGYLLGAE